MQYRQHVSEVTELFQTLSTEVAALRDIFLVLERTDLVDVVNRLQNLERQKLPLVGWGI